MKLRINKTDLSVSTALFLRQAGYHNIVDRRSGQESFVRRLRSDFYPRFHLYADEEGEVLVLNLHLDQKRPIYVGAPHAHNAEYDGEVVESEIARLKEMFGS